MSTCIFYYDGFCEFEIVFAAANFRKDSFTAALENRVYISSEKQNFLPDKTISELNPEDIDLFIIPGGDPSNLYDNQELKRFIKALNSKNKYIAGICGGTFLMAAYGLLDNKRCTGSSTGIEPGSEEYGLFKNSQVVNEDVAIDGNTITAVGKAFGEFSIELGRLLKIYKDENEIQEDYRWIKNIK